MSAREVPGRGRAKPEERNQKSEIRKSSPEGRSDAGKPSVFWFRSSGFWFSDLKYNPPLVWRLQSGQAEVNLWA